MSKPIEICTTPETMQSSKYPFRAPLDVLVDQQAHIGKQEATNEEAKELCGVAGTEFESNVSRGRVLETRILDLAGNLVCQGMLERDVQIEEEMLTNDLRREPQSRHRLHV